MKIFLLEIYMMKNLEGKQFYNLKISLRDLSKFKILEFHNLLDIW